MATKSMRKKRKKPSEQDIGEVLLKSRRRCALCFGLNGDFRRKRGQVAHVDHDPANSDVQNLAYLCIPHHDEYDSRTSQSKRITELELTTYRDSLYKLIEENPLALRSERFTDSKKRRRSTVPLEVYDRQLKVYRAADKFIRMIVREARIESSASSEFAAAIEEGLFLFDESFDAYLSDVLKKAVRLSSLDLLLKKEPVGARRTQLVSEKYNILIWFTDQLTGLRKKAYPFMKMTDV